MILQIYRVNTALTQYAEIKRLVQNFRSAYLHLNRGPLQSVRQHALQGYPDRCIACCHLLGHEKLKQRRQSAGLLTSAGAKVMENVNGLEKEQKS